MVKNSSEINMSKYWEARKVQYQKESKTWEKNKKPKLKIKAKTKPQTKQTNKQKNPAFFLLSSEAGQENTP